MEYGWIENETYLLEELEMQNKIRDIGLIVLSVLLGGGSMLLLVVFLFAGSLNFIDLGLGKTAALKFDALLCLFFFIQHSIMIRETTKQLLTRVIPEKRYSVFYSIDSGIALLIMIILWQETGSYLAEPGAVVSFFMRVVFVLSLAGFVMAGISLGMFDPFGIRQILIDIRGGSFREMPFTVRGAYRWVRHPLYFFFLLLIWSCPQLTADRLLLNILWTAWIVMGSLFEERDLVRVFGDAYRDYQDKTPMLIPFKTKPYPEIRSHLKNEVI